MTTHATARPWTLLLLAALLAGCTSSREKCDASRAEAYEAWTSYVVSLESAMEDARETVRTGSDLMNEHEARLAEPVKQAADARYERASGAWMRAFQGGLHKACTEDPPCAELKEKMVAAEDTLDDFATRLDLARRAQTASTRAVAEARAAADAVMVHGGYPVLKAAQKVTAQMAEHCEGIDPE